MFVIDYFDIDNMIQMIIISKIFFLYIRKSYIFMSQLGNTEPKEAVLPL